MLNFYDGENRTEPIGFPKITLAEQKPLMEQKLFTLRTDILEVFFESTLLVSNIHNLNLTWFCMVSGDPISNMKSEGISSYIQRSTPFYDDYDGLN